MKSEKLKQLGLILIVLIAAFFRFHNLWYSDFQGDEVSAQNFLFGEQDFISFVFTRSIGPGQFLINYVTNFIFRGSSIIEFFIRLPYAISGVLTVIITAVFTSKNFGFRKALFSTAFVSTSGLLIAFSRIVQYQSFIMLFSIYSIFLFCLWRKTKKLKFLVGCGITCGISILFHYDALSFIIPVFLVLIIQRNTKYLKVFVVPILLITGWFYIPFLLSPTFKTTYKYLFHDRLVSNFKFDSVYYSAKILNIYHSKEFLFVMYLGLAAFIYSLFKKSNNIMRLLLIATITLILLRFFNTSPNDFLKRSSVLISLFFLCSYIYKFQENFSITNLIEIWFLFSFFTYIIFATRPLTHIYTIFLPTFILISAKLDKFTASKVTAPLTLGVILISSISFNSAALIDPEIEYPWEEERYVFGKMYQGVANGETVEGIFGFPYNRSWKEISQDVKDLSKKYEIERYSTNEKYRIAKYHLQGYKFDVEEPDILIYVKNPQSLSTGEKPNKELLIEKNNYSIYRTEYLK